MATTACIRTEVCCGTGLLCLYRDETEPEMTADESVEKPEGWLDDEPELIADPSSERPEDWYVRVHIHPC